MSVRVFVAPDKPTCPGLSGVSDDPNAIVPNTNNSEVLQLLREPDKRSALVVRIVGFGDHFGVAILTPPDNFGCPGGLAERAGQCPPGMPGPVGLPKPWSSVGVRIGIPFFGEVSVNRPPIAVLGFLEGTHAGLGIAIGDRSAMELHAGQVAGDHSEDRPSPFRGGGPRCGRAYNPVAGGGLLPMPYPPCPRTACVRAIAGLGMLPRIDLLAAAGCRANSHQHLPRIEVLVRTGEMWQ